MIRSSRHVHCARANLFSAAFTARFHFPLSADGEAQRVIGHGRPMFRTELDHVDASGGIPEGRRPCARPQPLRSGMSSVDLSCPGHLRASRIGGRVRVGEEA